MSDPPQPLAPRNLKAAPDPPRPLAPRSLRQRPEVSRLPRTPMGQLATTVHSPIAGTEGRDSQNALHALAQGASTPIKP